MFNCAPIETVTFNDNPYAFSQEMTYHREKVYQYAIVYGKYEVHLGSGYLYFEQDEFFKYFKQVA